MGQSQQKGQIADKNDKKLGDKKVEAKRFKEPTDDELIKLVAENDQDLVGLLQNCSSAAFSKRFKSWPSSPTLLSIACKAIRSSQRSASEPESFEKALEAVRFMLKQNSDVNATDSFGRSALHWACFHGGRQGIALVKVLLAARADVTLATKARVEASGRCESWPDEPLILPKGSTPLHLAVQQRRASNLEIVDLLLQAGARVDAQDEHGMTPLCSAILCPLLVKKDTEVHLESHRLETSEIDYSRHALNPFIKRAQACGGILQLLVAAKARVNCSFGPLPKQLVEPDCADARTPLRLALALWSLGHGKVVPPRFGLRTKPAELRLLAGQFAQFLVASGADTESADMKSFGAVCVLFVCSDAACA
jgi:hypothetical protein